MYRVSTALPSKLVKVALCAFVGSVASAGERATYELTFDATWSAETHPTDFPTGPHFSSLIGATHNDNYTLWTSGGISSNGMESMAENGGTFAIENEVSAQIDAGNAGSILKGPNIRVSPDARSMTFDVDSDFPLVSLVSMIAPSPDWFVGIHDLELFHEGEWMPRTVLDLDAYDAGTDSGPLYRSNNDDTQPREPIRRLSDGPFLDTPPLGSFTLLRLIDGDLTRDGLLAADDINALSQAIRNGASDALYDVDTNGVVDGDDRMYWVEQLRQTVVGDANLDGRFTDADFVLAFIAGEYNDNVSLNSGWEDGDWDGDGEFTENDIVTAFIAGDYETTPAAVAAVPEPTGGLLSGVAALSLLAFGRRHGRRRTIV